jgi:site-specific DNA recombinase
MKAAIYARKSSDNEAGVSRQVEIARDFIAARKWTLDSAHVYTDNDVSGAVFSRPGLDAFMVAALAKPRPFDVLVVMDSSRLGREQSETLALQLRIVRTGCRIIHYQDGQELLLNTPVEKLIASVTNFSNEDFRHQIRLKTASALKKKAEQGHVAGSAVYGYDNRRVPSGSHTERVINEAEAAIVQRIFTWAAEGWGARRIARALNAAKVPHAHADHVCSPKCQHAPGKFKGWAATTIRAMLRNPIYTGVVMYRGQRLDVTVPRIIKPELWERTQAQMARARRAFSGKRSADGRLSGRPEAPVGVHLLSGLIVCGGCRGSMIAITRASAAKVRKYYVCAASYKRGADCPARHAIPYDRLHAAVLEPFEHLGPEVLGQMLDAELARMAEAYEAQRGSLDALKAEVIRLDAELGRLAEGVAQGGQLPILLSTIEAKQRARDDAAARLEHAQGLSLDGLPPRYQEMLAVVQGLAGGLKGLMGASQDAREILRSIITEPLTIRPTVDAEGRHSGWEWTGTAHLGKLITGKLGRVTKDGKPCGRGRSRGCSGAGCRPPRAPSRSPTRRRPRPASRGPRPGRG